DPGAALPCAGAGRVSGSARSGSCGRQGLERGELADILRSRRRSQDTSRDRARVRLGSFRFHRARGQQSRGGQQMTLNRRDILKGGAARSLAAALPAATHAQGAFAPQPGRWREFEVVTRLDIPNGSGAAQAWIPIPSVNEAAWFKSGASTWRGNGEATLV